MRHATLLELAERDGIRLPDQLVAEWPPELSAADEKGWFRFQRLYDVARSVLRTEADVRRLVLEAAEDDVARRRSAGWRSRSTRAGTPRGSAGSPRSPTWSWTRSASASAQTGLGMAVVIAANRTRHPLDARTLARLAAQYAGRGVVGFGLSNDERRGTTAGVRAARSGSPSGPGCGWSRTAASCSAPTTSAPASTRCTPAAGPRRPVGRGPRPAGPDRVRRCRARGLPGLQRGARRLLRPLVGAAARRCWRPAPRSRWAPTTRCCSAPGCSASTPPCAPPTTSATSSWPSWPGCRCAPRPPPRTCGSGCWAGSTAGWRSRPVCPSDSMPITQQRLSRPGRQRVRTRPRARAAHPGRRQPRSRRRRRTSRQALLRAATACLPALRRAGLTRPTVRLRRSPPSNERATARGARWSSAIVSFVLRLWLRGRATRLAGGAGAGPDLDEADRPVRGSARRPRDGAGGVHPRHRRQRAAGARDHRGRGASSSSPSTAASTDQPPTAADRRLSSSQPTSTGSLTSPMP